MRYRGAIGQDGLPFDAQASIEKFSRRKPDPRGPARMPATCRIVRRRRGVRRARRRIRSAGRPASTILPVDGPGVLPGDRRQAWSRGLERHPRSWQRIVIEKPFVNLASARQLNVEVLDEFETQVFRIDHYLTEYIQNLLALASPTRCLSRVEPQLTASRSPPPDIGIGSRALRSSRNAARPRSEPHDASCWRCWRSSAPASFEANRPARRSWCSRRWCHRARRCQVVDGGPGVAAPGSWPARRSGSPR